MGDLYKIEGTKERFIENSEINNQLQTTNGTTLTIGTLNFNFPPMQIQERIGSLMT